MSYPMFTDISSFSFSLCFTILDGVSFSPTLFDRRGYIMIEIPAQLLTDQQVPVNKTPKSGAKSIRVAIIGAGVRGLHLARQVGCFSPMAQIAAVAEPNPERQAQLAREHHLSAEAVFPSWEELVDSTMELDAAIIATMDNRHTAPALACLTRGLHLFMEKPLADTFEDCLCIVNAQQNTNRILSVCHTLRYLEPFQRMKEIVSEGRLGSLIQMEHTEAIGPMRFAHNYVRGRWARQENNTFLLLHKCCHDLDLIRWLAGQDCRQVSSFGSLAYFRPDRAPAGSGKRCLEDCRIADECPYSARRLYVETDLESWPAREICVQHTREAHWKAVQNGNWGSCVWHAGNDVVDHQTVMLEFDEGITATCILTGFSSTNGRRTRLQGTKGELLYEEAAGILKYKQFSSSEETTFQMSPSAFYHPEDKQIVGEWLSAIRDPSSVSVTVNAQDALRSNLLAFAAERARVEKRVVTLTEYYKKMEAEHFSTE
jgi:predicted dehydrogenase